MAVTDTRILIVDDQPDMRMALQMNVQKMNAQHIVSTASDGFEALDILRDEPFDMVITDYMMPGMDGLELIESIRALSPRVPIILTTALRDKTLEPLLADAQIEHFLQKPFTTKEIRQMVASALSASPSPLTMASPASKRTVDQTADDKLRELLSWTGSYACFVIASAGYVIASETTDENIPITTLASLMAANAMATSEVSNLLGNAKPFQSAILEGDKFNMASYTMPDKRILSVVFGKQVKIGLVQHFARQTVASLPDLLPAPSATLNRADFFNGSLDGDDFSTSIDASVDDLFAIA